MEKELTTQQSELSVHEKLKYIFNKIGYKGLFFRKKLLNNAILIDLDEREIIFTQEFMDKFGNYLFENNKKNYHDWWHYLLEHLNNPVSYLYNLIK